MNNLVPILLLLLAFSGCQTAKIKNEKYKVSSAVTELGSIGHASTGIDFKNEFSTRTLPKLENKIRLTIEIVPFNKKLSRFYDAKLKYDQSRPEVAYVDSLPVKPELVTVRFLDVAGFVKEINSEYNKEVLGLLSNTANAQVVSGVAISLSNENLAKLRLADGYYLANDFDQKYSISMYKEGKLVESFGIRPEWIVAYQLSSFCWAVDDRGKPYIADLVADKGDCKGSTKNVFSEKEKSNNLFKM